jgi:hypothetical protein
MHLEEMVLDDITDDTEAVVVAATILSAKRLLHCYLDIADVLVVPDACHELVGEAHDQQILHRGALV